MPKSSLHSLLSVPGSSPKCNYTFLCVGVYLILYQHNMSVLVSATCKHCLPVPLVEEAPVSAGLDVCEARGGSSAGGWQVSLLTDSGVSL